MGIAFRRTPRSSARIRPRGLSSGSAGGNSGGDSGGGDGSVPPPTSSRLLSQNALTPVAGSSGVLSPDAYLSGGSKRLTINASTDDRREPFSESKPLIQSGSTPQSAGGAGRGAESVVGGRSADAGGGASGSGSKSRLVGMNGAGADETKDRGGSVPATPGLSDGLESSTRLFDATASSLASAGVGIGSVVSPLGSARRPSGTGGIVSPPPSTGVGTDVRAAAGGGDESIIEASPEPGGKAGGGGGGGGAGGAAGGGRLFAEVLGASASAPKLGLEGYETKPPMSELAVMSDDELRAVSGFEVIRRGVGSIAWLRPVDLRNMDIGKLVSVVRVMGWVGLFRFFFFGGVSFRAELGRGERAQSCW